MTVAKLYFSRNPNPRLAVAAVIPPKNSGVSKQNFLGIMNEEIFDEDDPMQRSADYFDFTANPVLLPKAECRQLNCAASTA